MTCQVAQLQDSLIRHIDTSMRERHGTGDANRASEKLAPEDKSSARIQTHTRTHSQLSQLSVAGTRSSKPKTNLMDGVPPLQIVSDGVWGVGWRRARVCGFKGLVWVVWLSVFKIGSGKVCQWTYGLSLHRSISVSCER